MNKSRGNNELGDDHHDDGSNVVGEESDSRPPLMKKSRGNNELEDDHDAGSGSNVVELESDSRSPLMKTSQGNNQLGDDHDAGRRNVVLEDSDAGLAETELQRVISDGLDVQSAPAELSGRSLVFNDEDSIQSADEYVLQTAYYCAKLAVNFYNEHEKSKLEFLRLLKFKLVYLTTGMHTDEYDLTFKVKDGNGVISAYQAKVAFSETKGDRKAEVLLCQPSSYEPSKENRTIAAAAKIEPSEDEESDDSSDSESSEDEESKMGDDSDSETSKDEGSETGDDHDSEGSEDEEDSEMGDGPDSKRSGVEENEMGDGPDSKRSKDEKKEPRNDSDSKRSEDEEIEMEIDAASRRSEDGVGDGRDSKYLKDRWREESARVLFNWQWRISEGFDVDPNYCGLVCGGGARVFKDLARIKKLGKCMYHTAYYCAKFSINYRNEKEHEKSKLEFVELVKFNHVNRKLCYLPEMYYLTFKARSDGADIVSEYQAKVSFQEHKGERDAEVMLFRRRKSSKGV